MIVSPGVYLSGISLCQSMGGTKFEPLQYLSGVGRDRPISQRVCFAGKCNKMLSCQFVIKKTIKNVEQPIFLKV